MRYSNQMVRSDRANMPRGCSEHRSSREAVSSRSSTPVDGCAPVRHAARRLAPLLTAAVIFGVAFPSSAVAAETTRTEAAGADSYTDAVVLVSGFTTSTPFTTPDPSCVGAEGSSWSSPDGVGSALKDSGHDVFTAPTTSSAGGLPAPCLGESSAAPGPTETIDSDGEADNNGRALALFLKFLGKQYGVERVQLVGHSDGGLWSRAAITRSNKFSSFLDVRSLTTLGTPHTGSWFADVVSTITELRCSNLDAALKTDCKQLLGGASTGLTETLGGAAGRELTSNFLNTWNVRQRIAGCPAAGVAGTAIQTTTIDGQFAGLSTYFTPFDGVVGEASALARSAQDANDFKIPGPGIPNWTEGGTFDVVHSAEISEVNNNLPNLLDTAAVSAKAVELVESVPESGKACQTKQSGERTNQQTILRLPLYQLAGQNSKGRLPVPDDDDPVVVETGLNLFCGSAELDLVPLTNVVTFGSASAAADVAFPRGCEKKVRVLEADGSPADPDTAILARTHPANYAKIKVSNHKVRIQVKGPKVKDLRAKTRFAREWVRVDLDEKGRGKVQGKGNLSRLRIAAKTTPGNEWSEAGLAIAR